MLKYFIRPLTKPYHSISNLNLFQKIKNDTALVRWLVISWSFFVILVALGIHGSSFGSSIDELSLDVPETAPYLLNGADQFVQNLLGQNSDFSKNILFENSRYIRGDEWYKYTPAALAQAAHDPPFPVVNTNIGLGQNMLITSFQTEPVWHITAIARPATWGYFIFGAERGLAWQWWFSVVGCFTVLLLVFRTILKGHINLSAFGALWFGASAYVIAWSMWPAQTVMWAGLIFLTVYWLVKTNNWQLQLLNAVLLGISIIGFAMILYPPWQIPLVYLFAFLFVVLVLREKLYLDWRKTWQVRLGFLLLAAVIAGSLGLSWLQAGGDAFSLVANTDYPGKRVSLGGDYPFWAFFKGNFNLLTLYGPPYNPVNESESAGFYMFYPAIFGALIFSRGLRQIWGWVGWALIVYIAIMVEFVLFGFPDFLARLSLMSYVTTGRVDIGLGLASIMACLYLIVGLQEVKLSESKTRNLVYIGIVAAGNGLLFMWNALTAQDQNNGWPSIYYVLAIGLVTVFIVFVLLKGLSRVFYATIAILVAATSLFFNPISIGLGYFYNSEMAQHLKAIIDADDDEQPGMWLEYGSSFPIVSILGGRMFNETMWYPQYNLWQPLDPTQENKTTYNRHVTTYLQYTTDDTRIGFENLVDTPSALNLTISPTNPALQTVGAKFVLGIGDVQSNLDQSVLQVLYRSPAGSFTIYQIPPANNKIGYATSASNLDGSLDVADCNSLAGWTWDSNQPDTPLKLELYDGDKLVTGWLAGNYRDDLEHAKIGTGWHGFDFPLPESLQDNQPHQLSIKVAGSDYRLLSGSASTVALTCS